MQFYFQSLINRELFDIAMYFANRCFLGMTAKQLLYHGVFTLRVYQSALVIVINFDIPKIK